MDMLRQQTIVYIIIIRSGRITDISKKFFFYFVKFVSIVKIHQISGAQRASIMPKTQMKCGIEKHPPPIQRDFDSHMGDGRQSKVGLEMDDAVWDAGPVEVSVIQMSHAATEDTPRFDPLAQIVEVCWKKVVLDFRNGIHGASKQGQCLLLGAGW